MGGGVCGDRQEKGTEDESELVYPYPGWEVRGGKCKDRVIDEGYPCHGKVGEGGEAGVRLPLCWQ